MSPVRKTEFNSRVYALAHLLSWQAMNLELLGPTVKEDLAKNEANTEKNSPQRVKSVSWLLRVPTESALVSVRSMETEPESA